MNLARSIALAVTFAGSIAAWLLFTTPPAPKTLVVGLDPFADRTVYSEPTDVTGKVVLRPSNESGKHDDVVLELDHPITFQGRDYTAAILNDYNDHIMFQTNSAISHRIETHCRFSEWIGHAVLCSPDEIELVH